MKTLLLFAIIAMLFVSCEKDIKTNNAALSSSLQDAAQIQYLPYLEHTAQPQQTDPTITTVSLSGNITQYAYLPADASARKNKLFIFLPGTGATPYYYLKIIKTAASQGYYSLGIAYTNTTDIDDYNYNAKNNTIENIMEEYLTGNDTSPLVDVPKQNGFLNRIKKMILYMNSQYPSENWKRFLTADNNIIWSKIVIAGHSQGSDHAMYISQQRNCFRAAFFGGPGNYVLPNGRYPTFMTKDGATLRSSVYGLNHTADYIRPWNNVKKVWSVLNMPGNPESVDDGIYNGKHKFYSSLPVNDGHSAIVYDSEIPNDAYGRPVYEPVWIKMCFPK